MNNVLNTVPFLRTSREFPEELHQLTVEVNKSYIDIANVVNKRIIGLFTVNRPTQNGESWFISQNQKQQGFRQVYPFGAIISGATINLGFKLSSISQPTRAWGQYIDSLGNFYGIMWATNIAILGQVTFYLAPSSNTKSDVITFLVDSVAPAPTIVSGFVVIEWISQV